MKQHQVRGTAFVLAEFLVDDEGTLIERTDVWEESIKQVGYETSCQCDDVDCKFEQDDLSWSEVVALKEKWGDK